MDAYVMKTSEPRQVSWIFHRHGRGEDFRCISNGKNLQLCLHFNCRGGLKDGEGYVLLHPSAEHPVHVGNDEWR